MEIELVVKWKGGRGVLRMDAGAPIVERDTTGEAGAIATAEVMLPSETGPLTVVGRPRRCAKENAAEVLEQAAIARGYRFTSNRRR